MLHYRYATHAAAVVSCGIFLALAQVQFANYVDDVNVKLLAYLAAFIAAVGGFGWLVLGAATYFKYQSMLRQAEAVSPTIDLSDNEFGTTVSACDRQLS